MSKVKSAVVQDRKSWQKPALVRLAVSSTENRKHKSTTEPGDKNASSTSTS